MCDDHIHVFAVTCYHRKDVLIISGPPLKATDVTEPQCLALAVNYIIVSLGCNLVQTVTNGCLQVNPSNSCWDSQM